MEDENNFLMPLLYLGLASIAGAVVALSLRAYQNMSKVDIAMALFSSAAFGFFLGPWVTKTIWPSGPIDLQLQGAVYFGLSTGSNVLIAVMIKKLKMLLNAVFSDGAKEPLT